MIDRNNTSTNDYVLCSDCKFGLPYTKEDYICFRINETVSKVGVCRDFVGGSKHD